MFTPDSLLDIAIQQEAIVAANPQVPGTINDTNYQARRLRDKALHAAAWMQEQGIAQAEHVGEFESFKVNRSDTVRLRKGAVIFSTNPQVPREGKVNAMNRKVRVHSVHQGYVDYSGMSRGEVRNATIHWSGTGSYWYWTDINNVELV